MSEKKLLYFYDALCGWCYGFRPVLRQLHDKYGKDLPFEVVSGGMVLGEREGPIGEVAAYIKDAYRQVELTTGVTFGAGFLHDILADGTARFSSWYPAVALEVLRSEKPDQALEFAHALQYAVYHTGIRPAVPEAYGPLAAEFGMDADSFVDRLDQEAFAERARDQFRKTASFQVGGFPTLILQYGEEYFMISRGYMGLDMLDFRLEQVLAAQDK